MTQTTAHALEAPPVPMTGPEEQYVLVNRDGSVQFATESVHRWLDETGLAELRLVVDNASRGMPTESKSGRFRAQVIVGSDRSRGERTYLIRLRPRIDETTLTPRQREIAEYAAAGATALEIARHLGISHHTVRQHLKQAYRALGVGSRVELARALG